jgi:uncharacterized repeat protein (TIGR03803 family)
MTNRVQHLGRMGIRRRVADGTLALVILLLSLVVTTRSAQAQTLTVLYSFKNTPDGARPNAGLIRDAAGNLYGTTWRGGTFDYGTVFKLNEAGKYKVLHSFTGRVDGGSAYSPLIRDPAGNLYGTTWSGGDRTGCCGALFKLDATGKETLLHGFAGGDGDGGEPSAGLIRDAAGNLYGTTTEGGPSNYGTVFKLNAAGKYRVLYFFTGASGADGANPYSGLIRDSAGNLYGTTLYGGIYENGTVFKLDTTGKETVLHAFTGSFTGGADGAWPKAGLIRDPAGNLYGTTLVGGLILGCTQSSTGCGTVFKLDGTGIETVLYSFTGWADGAIPLGGLIRDPAGNLYGTTQYGGDLTCPDFVPFGCGTVFKLDATGKVTVLHSFTGGAGGANPYAGLIRDAAGNLFGTTYNGGTSGFGTVFKLTP